VRTLPLLLLLAACDSYPMPEAPDAGTGCTSLSGARWTGTGFECGSAAELEAYTLIAYHDLAGYQTQQARAVLGPYLVQQRHLPGNLDGQTDVTAKTITIAWEGHLEPGIYAHEVGHVLQWELGGFVDENHRTWRDAGFDAAIARVAAHGVGP
jgi:hypothetical protein